MPRITQVRRTGDKPFEVEAFGEANRWIKGISEIYINTLDFGTLPSFDWNWFDDVHENRWSYQDGTLPIFPPVANYGKRVAPGCISIEDLRIWFSPLFILREGFCKAGWKFVCPMLESDTGRRLWIYILAEDFQNRSAGTSRAFNATLTTPVAIPGFTFGTVPAFVFDNDSVTPGFDNGGFYDNTTGQFGGTALKSDFTVQITVTGTSTPIAGASGVFIEIRKRNSITNSLTTIVSGGNNQLTTGTHTLTVTASDVVVTASDIIEVAVVEIGFPGTVDSGTFYNVPKEAQIAEGDSIELSQIISSNYTVLDLLKGMVHLFNWKVETDSILREVRFFPEDGGEWYTEGDLEAFFRSNEQAKDWTDKVVCNTMEVDIKANKTKRNFLLEFKKDNGDFLVKEAPFDYPLHSKNIDFGSDFKEGTKKSPNPFFAATINDFDFAVRYIWGGGSTGFPDTVPYIPHLWKSERSDDGTEPEQITKVVPRIVLAHEFGRMLVPPYGANGSQTSGDFTICRDIYPDGVGGKAYYSATGQIFPPGFRNSIPSGGVPVDYKDAVVYGSDEYNANLPGNYEIFYKDAIDRIYFAVPIEFLIRLTLEDFLNFSPRDRIFIRYFSDRFGEINFYSRVSKISDFVLNKMISTPVELQPNDQSFTLDCCNCSVFIEGRGFASGLGLQFFANLVGNCGEVISFEWTLSNLGSNVGFTSGQDEQAVFVGSASGTFIFTLDVVVVTTCGNYATSVNVG